jgi:hypothetical protein
VAISLELSRASAFVLFSAVLGLAQRQPPQPPVDRHASHSSKAYVTTRNSPRPPAFREPTTALADTEDDTEDVDP